MRTQKVLLVYYSRTGTTRLVADGIAAAIPCDVEEIVDTKSRAGVLGYVRAAFDAAFRRLTTLRPMRCNPGHYDLVIVGTPVWNASVSSPVLTYLTMHKGLFRRVAFFCTYRGSGGGRALRQMSEACGAAPVRALDLREGAVRRGEHSAALGAFVAGLVTAEAAA